MKNFKITFILIGILINIQAYSQFYVTGQEPYSLRWNILKKDNLRIIYPRGNDSLAHLLMKRFVMAQDYVSYSLPSKNRRLSIVLRSNTSISNGFVTLAPRRMELFNTPSQDIEPIDWFDLLAIHEYRHVKQFDYMNQGLNKAFYYFMGEQLVAGYSAMMIPNWYWEGDAVVTETSLTKSGRGRIPDFDVDLRAQLVDKKKYSYNKAVFGSFKHYTPNHYTLGYHLVSYGRIRWGAELWESAVSYVGYPWPNFGVKGKNDPNNRSSLFFINGFNHGIKLYTGISKVKLYNMVLDSLKKKITEDNKIYLVTNQQPLPCKECYPIKDKKLIPPPQNSYTNISFPIRINDSSTLAYRTGFSFYPQIINISNNGTVSNVLNIGGKVYGNPISTNGKTIVWNQYNSDIRWGMKDYTDIYTYNIETQKKIQLTKRTRYFSPTISPDNTTIATVHVSDKNIYTLVLLDATTGNEIKTLRHPDNEFIITPSWHSDNKTIVCILLGKNGKRLVTWNTEHNEIKELISPTYINIKNPIFYKDYVLFSYSKTGKDEIFAINTNTGSLYQITGSRFGADFPSVYNDTLFYSDFTADGYKPNVLLLDTKTWKEENALVILKNDTPEILAKQEKGIPDFYDTTHISYKKKPYRRLLHIVNIHSWGPASVQYNTTEIEKIENGIFINSQNLLSTAIIKSGYFFGNEKVRGWRTEFYYYGFYPIFTTSFELGEKFFEIKNDTNLYSYNRNIANINVTLPFNFSQGNITRTITITAINQYTTTSPNKNTPNVSLYNPLTGKTYSIISNYYTTGITTRCNFLLKKRYKDLYPQLGAIGQAGVLFTIPAFSSVEGGPLSYSSLSLLLPGMLRHHSTLLYAAYQNQNTNSIITYSNKIRMVRGYKDYSPFSKDIVTVNANYHFTICNPDASIGGFMYVKRLKGNIFYDKTFTNKDELSSIGFEFTNDFYLFRTPLPFDLGIRFSYLIEKNHVAAEFMAAFNLDEL
ncbi:MAG: hypothetical protein SNJ71_01080 [Bacteroidales bacterium]